MRRADRLFQIIQLLRGGRLITAQTLSERLEVSKRTIYRDIADLIGSQVPIEGEAGLGYMLRDGHDIPPLMFSPDELTALVAGARLIRAWGGENMAQAAEEALMKISDVLPKNLQTHLSRVAIHSFSPLEMDVFFRERLDHLEYAEQNRVKLLITYNDEAGKTTQRLIRPLGLVFWGRVWVVVAWCELRSNFRSFRVDRITSLEEKDVFSFDPQKSFKAFLDQGCGA